MTPNQWSREVGRVIREYRGRDMEHAHGEEDDLLWRFVKDYAEQGDSIAKRLLRLDETPRVRWYA